MVKKMFRGIEEYSRILNKFKGRKLMLYGDPDGDGLFSLKLEIDFAEQCLGRTDYEYYVNDDRLHGFMLDPKSLSGYLVITADFGMTRAQLQELVDNDVVVLATDHHDIDSSDDNNTFIHVKAINGEAEGIFINNQYAFEDPDKKYLSGAGVFYEVINKIYPEFVSKEHRAMIGITLLTDIRDIGNEDSRKYLRNAYTIDCSQGYFKTLLEEFYSGNRKDYQFGVPRLTRNFIDFSLSPFINALLRYGRKQDAINFVLEKGITTPDDVQHQQKDLIAEMLERAKTIELSNLAIVCVGTNGFADQTIKYENFIGAVCSKYKDTHNDITTMGLIIRHGVVTRASVRGKYDDVDYKFIFVSNGIKAGGHINAFGIRDFKPDREGKIFDQLNVEIEDAEACQHTSSRTVLNIPNLMTYMLNNGIKDATENMYVRDKDRVYYRYTGKNYEVVSSSYKEKELTEQDLLRGEVPDRTSKYGKMYRVYKNPDGTPQYKYIEYLVDGKQVKSFGVKLEDGLIMPLLDRGYVTLYVQSDFTKES